MSLESKHNMETARFPNASKEKQTLIKHENKLVDTYTCSVCIAFYILSDT